MVCLTLQEVLEGNDEMVGADGLWETLKDNQKASLTAMYKTYEAVMSKWYLPNIEDALEDTAA